MSDGLWDAFKWLAVKPAKASQAEVYAMLDASGDQDRDDGLSELDLSIFLDDPTIPGTPFDKYKDFYEQFRKQQDLEKQCDCGSEKTYGKGSNLHTDWCSKAMR